MRDKELYTAILGVVRPWLIDELDAEAEQVPVRIDCHGSAVPCPKCGTDCPRHDHVSGAERKIAFRSLPHGEAAGRSRQRRCKIEHRELRASGNDTLLRTKYLWLQNPENLTERNHARFERRRDSNL